MQPVGAAGQPGHAVGEFAEDQRDAERDHQAREIGAAQHEETRDVADDGADQRRGEEAEGRIAEEACPRAGLGEQARDIGAQSEKGAVAERDDAGVAQHDIEGQGEESPDGDFIE